MSGADTFFVFTIKLSQIPEELFFFGETKEFSRMYKRLIAKKENCHRVYFLYLTEKNAKPLKLGNFHLSKQIVLLHLIELSDNLS